MSTITKPSSLFQEELCVLVTNVLQLCEELVLFTFYSRYPGPQHVCVCTSGGIVEVNVSADHSHQVWGAEDHSVSDVFPPWWHWCWALLLFAAFVYSVHSQLALRYKHWEGSSNLRTVWTWRTEIKQLKERPYFSFTRVYHHSDRIICSTSVNWQREVSFLPENWESWICLQIHCHSSLLCHRWNPERDLDG